MLNKAFFKRIIPFVAAFVIGLFVASFFVNIAPNFNFKRKRPPCRPKETRMLRIENERLRMENQRLQERLNDRIMLLEDSVPPPPPMAPRVMEMPLIEAPAHR
jgi:hypothetical protein